MRDKLTTAAELLGGISITIGCALIDAAAGFIVGGALLVLAGIFGGRE